VAARGAAGLLGESATSAQRPAAARCPAAPRLARPAQAVPAFPRGWARAPGSRTAGPAHRAAITDQPRSPGHHQHLSRGGRRRRTGWTAARGSPPWTTTPDGGRVRRDDVPSRRFPTGRRRHLCARADGQHRAGTIPLQPHLRLERRLRSCSPWSCSARRRSWPPRASSDHPDAGPPGPRVMGGQSQASRAGDVPPYLSRRARQPRPHRA